MTPESRRDGQAEGQLLHRQVPRVGRRPRAVALQVDDERAPRREGEPLPGIERVATTEPALDSLSAGSCDARGVGKHLLRASPAYPRPPELAAKARDLFEIPSSRLGRERGPLVFRHDGCMVSRSAYQRLMPPVAPGRDHRLGNEERSRDPKIVPKGTRARIAPQRLTSLIDSVGVEA